MQKTLFVLAALCARAASASPLIVTDPIYMTGSGSWYTSLGQAGQTVSARGSNAAGAISAAFDYFCDNRSGPYVGASFVTPNGQCSAGFGTFIDSVSYRYTGYF